MALIANTDAAIEQVFPQHVPPDQFYEATFSRGGVMLGSLLGVVGAGVVSWMQGVSIFSDTLQGAVAGAVGGLAVGKLTGSIVDLCLNRGHRSEAVVSAAMQDRDIEAQENLWCYGQGAPAGFDAAGRYAVSVVRVDMPDSAVPQRYWGWGGSVAGTTVDRIWAALAPGHAAEAQLPAAPRCHGSSSTSQYR